MRDEAAARRTSEIDTAASLEVGPNAFLAAAIVEAALGGGVSGVRQQRNLHHAYVFDTLMTDGRRAVVRIAPPEGRAALCHTKAWIDRLNEAGVPVPRVLAFDGQSEFSSIVLEHMPGKRLGQIFSRLSLPAQGVLAGRLADMQALIAAIEPAPAQPGLAHGPDNRPGPKLRWSEVLAVSLRHSRHRIELAGLIPASVADRVEARLTRLVDLLDHIPATLFMVGRLLSEAVVTESGQLTGITDTGRFFRGDGRVVPAFALVDLLNAGHSGKLAEAWLALSGSEADASFWLYAAIGCLHLMGDYGGAQADAAMALKPSDRMRLEGVLDIAITRIDRLR
ncbi:MAG TPA: phosphotransferase [Stellaceae bacterium]|jgi:hypothetical protein|nr:phosphotransferase [Stellaceae bacterium]